MTTLHILPMDKFVPDFINFVNNNFAGMNQHFVTYGNEKKYPFTPSKNHIHFRKFNFFYYLYIFVKIQTSSKIVLHSLLDIKLVFLLSWNKKILNRCYWVIWGDEIYQHDKFDTIYWKNRESLKQVVFSKIPYLVTTTKGDVQLAQKLYGNQGKQISCFTYPSNIYKKNILNCNDELGSKDSILIQVGNSCNPTNKHEKVFNLVKGSNLTKYKIFCPLAYGDPKYGEKVSRLGQELFSKKITFQKSLINLADYNQKLSSIDIGIFAQTRQQAAGNIITLLGMGKTIYMNTASPLFDYFTSLDLVIHDYEDGLYIIQTESISKHNIKQIEENFSEEMLRTDLRKWIC